MRMKVVGMILCFLPLSLCADWEPDVRLTNYINSDYGSYNNAWTIAVWDTMVHIVWEHSSVGNWIYYIRSTNSGESFEPDTQLTPPYSHHPSIAVQDSIVHVVWEDHNNDEIYYKRSVDNGENWEPDIRLSNDPAISWYPSIAICDTTVHVVWYDKRDDEIYYKRSVDNGKNWKNSERLSNSPSGSSYPSIAVHDLMVHVVWTDWRDGKPEIYYKRSVDNGENWEPDIRLSDVPNISWFPSIGVCDTIVHVVWHDNRANYEIYYKRSIDNGVNWGIDTRLTWAPDTSYNPSIAVRDSVIHVVWWDKRDGNREIYYKRSVDNGENWGLDERLTYDSTLYRWYPSVACWDCPYDVHVVWTNYDTTFSFWWGKEIHYKRHKCEPQGVEEISEESQIEGYRLQVVKGTVYLFTPDDLKVDVRVYDVCGRVVDVLNKPRGEQKLIWKNKGASGVYFFVVEFGKEKIRLKAIIF
ncbi:hypothetical protein KAW50_04980 [candidate division WOR-3 bacterium]|nr:hypothetical protein [candidate division WOR-3 bacterium]